MAPLAAAGGDVASAFVQLGAVGVGLAVLARLGFRGGLSPIPFYLLAGLILGATDVVDFGEDFVLQVSQVGVVLLLFMLGLEYTGEELSENLRAGLRAGFVDLGLNFTPGLALGLVLGWDPRAALLLGGVTYISSSGVIAKVVADLGRLGNRETPAILSVLVLEDLAMAVYLPLVAVLLVGGGLISGVGSLALAVGTVALVLMLALRHGERVSRLLHHPSDEVVVLTTFGLVLLVGGIAEQLQVSSAIGAFLVGIALSGPVADRARELLSPLRDLFAATFFLFFGLQIDAGALPGVAGLAIGLAALTAGTKLVTGWYAAGRAGVALRGRVRAGTALVARGEFSIVIAGLGVGAALEPRLGPLAAAYVLLTALAGPLLTRYADSLSAAWQERRRRRPARPPAPAGAGGER